MIKNKYFETT